jgi:hypothetical protein
MLLLLAAAASRQPVKGHSRQLLAALCEAHTHTNPTAGMKAGSVVVELQLA